MKTERFNIKARSGSFRYAFDGLIYLIKNEHNARIHLLAAVVAVIAGIVLKIDLSEWCILIIAIGLVFLAELFNSSLEALGDAVDPEWNERIKKAKDYAAGAVLISAIISVLAGGLIFIPRLIALF